MAFGFVFALLWLVVPSEADDCGEGSTSPGCRTVKQRALQALDGTLPTTTPVAEGCHTLGFERCCLHNDSRDRNDYRGQQCRYKWPPGETFTSGNLCEPSCWARGECGSGTERQMLIGNCDTIHSDENVTMLPNGFTCDSQGLQNLTQDECQEAFANVRAFFNSARFSARPLPFNRISNEWTAGGCMFFSDGSNTNADDSLFIYYNALNISREASLTMRYLCKTP